MRKAEAIKLLGGSTASAALAVGVTYQAVDKWPDELSAKIADRVQAALWRIANGIPHPVRAAQDDASDDEAATQQAA